MKRLSYLCLQATREGQASYAHVHEIIKGLRKRGWKVQLFVPKYNNKNVFPGPLMRLIAFIRIQFLLLIDMIMSKPDLLYIRNHFGTFMTALVAKMIHKPVVQEVNGPYEDLFIAWPMTRKLEPIFKLLIRIQLKWADAVVTVTPQLGDWVKRESRHYFVEVIPNAANTQLFHPQAHLAYELSKPYVVFFGALAKWQGIPTMISAANSPFWPSDLKLVILGDGAEANVVRQAASYNSKIVYLGTVPYSKVPGIVANSLIALIPENNIGDRAVTGLFPLKLFESMACGVPVIVTDFPGQADLVRKYNCGLVIPAEDVQALVEAVCKLYTNPVLRLEMGMRGREAVENDHSWDNRAAKTDVLLLRITK